MVLGLAMLVVKLFSNPPVTAWLPCSCGFFGPCSYEFLLGGDGCNQWGQQPMTIWNANHCVHQLSIDFSSSLTWTVERHVSAFRLIRIFLILSAGKLIHLVEPSKSHPKISFLVAHSSLPCFNFFTNMGSSS